jgi:ribosomal-protein-alanine N-acetyltransferase
MIQQPLPAFLLSSRLYLREVRAEDVNDHYYRWMNDAEVTRYLETRYLPQSRDNILAYVKAMQGKADEIFLAICLRSDNRHIGNIKLGPLKWIHRYGDISLLIGEKDCWGKGYASEAIRLLCEYAFGTLNLRKVCAGAYADNIGSIRAFENVGFVREGALRGQFVVGGQAIDHVLLGLLVQDYDSHKGQSSCN